MQYNRCPVPWLLYDLLVDEGPLGGGGGAVLRGGGFEGESEMPVPLLTIAAFCPHGAHSNASADRGLG